MEWFRGREPGRTAFRTLLSLASGIQPALCISRVNLGEIHYTTAKDFGEDAANALVQQLTAIYIEVVSVSDADIDAAARLKGRYKISYADAFAAVLSINRKAPLVTGDDEFRVLERDGLIQLHWVGR